MADNLLQPTIINLNSQKTFEFNMIRNSQHKIVFRRTITQSGTTSTVSLIGTRIEASIVEIDTQLGVPPEENTDVIADGEKWMFNSQSDSPNYIDISQARSGIYSIIIPEELNTNLNNTIKTGTPATYPKLGAPKYYLFALREITGTGVNKTVIDWQGRLRVHYSVISAGKFGDT